MGHAAASYCSSEIHLKFYICYSDVKTAVHTHARAHYHLSLPFSMEFHKFVTHNF